VNRLLKSRGEAGSKKKSFVQNLNWTLAGNAQMATTEKASVETQVMTQTELACVERGSAPTEKQSSTQRAQREAQKGHRENRCDRWCSPY
jgi:hypothetical protein